MKYEVLDKKAKKVEEMNLSDKIFGIEPHLDVLGLYVRVYNANNRQGTSSTKTRGEVSGGGIKPWRQKGTGRARVGSSRNPIWRHGGVSHGPKPRSWSLSLNKKVKTLALKTALTLATLSKRLYIVDNFNFDSAKTKNISDLLSDFKLNGRALFISENKNENLIKSSANIQKTQVTFVGVLNAFDIVRAKNVLIEKEAVKVLEGKYINESK